MNAFKFYPLLFFLFSSLFVYSQEVTDYDLERFAKAYNDMVKLNLQAQNEMAKIITNEKLDLEVYHAIDESKENSDYEPDVPKEDYEKYDKVQPKIQKVQEKLESDVKDAYAKRELTPKEYSAISERVKQDQILQIKLESILSKFR